MLYGGYWAEGTCLFLSALQLLGPTKHWKWYQALQIQKKDAKALHYFFLRTINELFFLLDLPSPKAQLWMLCYFLSATVYVQNVEYEISNQLFVLLPHYSLAILHIKNT